MNVGLSETCQIADSSTTIQNKQESLALKSTQDFPMQTFKIPEVGNLRALSIVNDDNVWASGANGCILHTQNRGKNWAVHRILEVKDLDFRAIHAFNAREACAMSAGLAQNQLARIYRTENGGSSWRLAFSTEQPKIFLNGMRFWDDQNGIVLGDPIDGYFALFRTHDGGHHWERLIPDIMPPALPEEAAFAASNSCLIVQGTHHVWFATGRGSVARVFSSSDRGCNWEVTETPIKPYNETSGIFSIAFRNEKEGIAVGGDHAAPLHFSGCNIITTQDGGLHWQPQISANLSGRYLSSVAWSSEREAIVVEGYSKTFNAVAYLNQNVWAVGSDGLCAHYSI